jgi:nucleoid-associated protein YgaU
MQFRPRKYIALTLLISGLLAFSPLKAEKRGDQFSLTVDAMGQALFPYNGGSPNYGPAGMAFLDWRFMKYISLGFGGEYLYYLKDPTFSLYTFDCAGRIFPLDWNPQGEFYLQGGVGLNLKAEPGHYHGYAGLGWRQTVGDHMALDLAAQYDYFSPYDTPHHGATAKVGLTYLIGRDDWSEPPPNLKLKPRTLQVGEVWSGPSTYVWKAGDDFRAVAFRLYGDEGLFTLIVDANKDLLTKAPLKAGLVLKVPPPPTKDIEVDRYEDLAVYDDKYNHWQELSAGALPQASNPNVDTYRWQKGDDLPSVAQKLYGDEDMYPLLVDANKKRLILPDNLTPGKVLKVPALPPQDKLDEVRIKGWNDSEYIHWRNISLNHFHDVKGY